MRPVLACLLICLSSAAFCQKTDSLFVQMSETGWMMRYKVKSGETLFALARRFHVPPSILADANEMNYQTSLKVGQTIEIPVGAYNQLNARPAGNDFRPLYYKPFESGELRRIARLSSVSQRTVQQWNKLELPEVAPGKPLLIGWIRFDATDVGLLVDKKEPLRTEVNDHFPEPAITRKPVRADTLFLGDARKRDTIRLSRKTELPPAKHTVARNAPDVPDSSDDPERVFDEHIAKRSKVVSEKGTAAFYPGTGRQGAFYYALHNTAPKGSVIKVFNPGTEKTIYVKVLGKMPATRLYHNCVIGISAAAREALGATTEKAWCELTYAP